MLIGVLIAGLPRELKDAQLNQSGRRSEEQAGQMDKIHARSGTIKDAHKSTLIILRNYPFLMMVFAMSFEGGYRAALVTYGTKYIL